MCITHWFYVVLEMELGVSFVLGRHSYHPQPSISNSLAHSWEAESWEILRLIWNLCPRDLQPRHDFSFLVTRSKPDAFLYKGQRLLFTSLAGHSGRREEGVAVAIGVGGSEDAGATHSDGLHDDAVATGPRARSWRTEAATHWHLAEHWHAHHAAVLLHGEGVHAAQT